ncbi:MAG: T9SS type A sorting domain-containing protein, partial [Ignavibacteria bacterium]|nr:T9SS type A sorting domain-containing protein [Ignavibacteria bacterium]MCC6867172.1 T9SS type A sorting domain-containing protein [Ignavibacteria bacterium]
TYHLNYNAGKLSSGIYLYTLSSEKEKVTRKFILIK